MPLRHDRVVTVAEAGIDRPFVTCLISGDDRVIYGVVDTLDITVDVLRPFDDRRSRDRTLLDMLNAEYGMCQVDLIVGSGMRGKTAGKQP
jgi:hypothetical protein